MKILHLLMFPLSGSGSGTYTKKLAEIYSKEYPKDEVAILCPCQNGKSEEVKGVEIFKLKMPFKVAFTGHPSWPDCKIYSQLTGQEMDIIFRSFTNSVMEVFYKFKPDVIHVHHISHFAFIANYIRSIFSVNYIITSHGTGILCASQDKRWVPLSLFGLNSAYYINAVSGDTKKWMKRVFGEKKYFRRVRIITGGVDVSRFSSTKDYKEVERKYKLKGKNVVLFTGKITQKKGVEYLVKAAPKINGEVFIVGGGDDLDRLKAIVRRRDIRNVHFTGYIKDRDMLGQFYKRANVFVFPSVWDEPLGLVALEAMACGTPVVASKKGGIPLAVKDGYNGYLVRPKSPKQIAEKVNKILEDRKLQDRLSKNARRTVEEKFDWRIIAKRFHQYYDEAYQDSLNRRKSKVYIPEEEIIREAKEIKSTKLDV